MQTEQNGSTLINFEVNKNIKVHPSRLFKGIVKPIGNGAMVSFPKKYVGRKVYVILRNET